MKEVRLGLSQLRPRYKIMLAGATASGKTWNSLKLVLANPDRQFFMIDPDGGVAELILDVFGGVAAFGNLEYRLCATWPDIYTAYLDASKMLKEGDWLIAEHLGRWHDKVQDHYAQAKYNKSIEDLALEASMADKGVLIGGLATGDWVEVRRQLNRAVYPMLSTDKYNVLATTDLREIQDFRLAKMPEAQRRQIEIFEEIGYRPGGEKHVPDMFSDIVILARDRQVISGQTIYTHTAQMVKKRGIPLKGDIVAVDDEGVVKAVMEKRL